MADGFLQRQAVDSNVIITKILRPQNLSQLLIVDLPFFMKSVIDTQEAITLYPRVNVCPNCQFISYISLVASLTEFICKTFLHLHISSICIVIELMWVLSLYLNCTFKQFNCQNNFHNFVKNSQLLKVSIMIKISGEAEKVI